MDTVLNLLNAFVANGANYFDAKLKAEGWFALFDDDGFDDDSIDELLDACKSTGLTANAVRKKKNSDATAIFFRGTSAPSLASCQAAVSFQK